MRTRTPTPIPNETPPASITSVSPQRTPMPGMMSDLDARVEVGPLPASGSDMGSRALLNARQRHLHAGRTGREESEPLDDQARNIRSRDVGVVEPKPVLTVVEATSRRELVPLIELQEIGVRPLEIPHDRLVVEAELAAVPSAGLLRG